MLSLGSQYPGLPRLLEYNMVSSSAVGCLSRHSEENPAHPNLPLT